MRNFSVLMRKSHSPETGKEKKKKVKHGYQLCVDRRWNQCMPEDTKVNQKDRRENEATESREATGKGSQRQTCPESAIL